METGVATCSYVLIHFMHGNKGNTRSFRVQTVGEEPEKEDKCIGSKVRQTQ